MNLLLILILLCSIPTSFSALCQPPQVGSESAKFYDFSHDCIFIYSFPNTNKRFILSWSITKNDANERILNMTIIANSSGYIAIAFTDPDPPYNMKDSDSITTYERKDGIKEVKAFTLPSSDDIGIQGTLDCAACNYAKSSNYLIESSLEVIPPAKGKYENLITMRFARKLNTRNQTDVVIDEQRMGIMFAIGLRFALKWHSSKGSAIVNLMSAHAVVAPEAAFPQTPFVLFFSVLFGIFMMTAFTMKFCQNGLCGDLLLHQRLGLPPKKETCCGNKWFRIFTLDAFGSAMSMTWSEFLGAILYFFGCMITTFILLYEHYEMEHKKYRVMTGWMMALSLMMNLLPVTKNSIWVKALGIPYDRAIKYHRLLSRVSLVVGFAHFVAVTEFAHWNILSQQKNEQQHDGTWGFVSYTTMIIMALFSMLRRRYWEIFKFSHYLFILVVVAQLIHVDDQTINYTMILVPISLWVIDKIISIYYICTKHRVEIVKMDPLHQVTMLEMKLRNDQKLKFEAGNYCFICIPDISPFEWHPFSISSSPSHDNFTFHIKKYGEDSWTGKLYTWASSENEDQVLQRSSGKSTAISKVYIDGPYGRLSVRLEKYRTVILCGAGIGVTPLASILSELHTGRKEKYTKLKKVALIWVIRNSAFITWFTHLFGKIRDEKDEDYGGSRTSGHRFEVRIYNTNKAGEPQHPLGEWDEEEDMGEDMIGAMVGRLGQTINEMEELEEVQDAQERGLKELTGRPNFRELFLEITGGARNPNEVAVITAGPIGVCSTAEYEATRMGFHFHKESFFL